MRFFFFIDPVWARTNPFVQGPWAKNQIRRHYRETPAKSGFRWEKEYTTSSVKLRICTKYWAWTTKNQYFQRDNIGMVTVTTCEKNSELKTRLSHGVMGSRNIWYSMTKVLRYYGVLGLVFCLYLYYVNSILCLFFFMCSEKQHQLDQIDKLTFKRCNYHLNGVDKIQWGKHNPPARFFVYLLSRVVLSQTYSTSWIGGDPCWLITSCWMPQQIQQIPTLSQPLYQEYQACVGPILAAFFWPLRAGFPWRALFFCTVPNYRPSQFARKLLDF